MRRLAGLLIAASVAAQALAPSGAVLVCKYTGKVIAPCACPGESRKGAAGPSLESQTCCELRAAPPSIPALAKTATPSLPRPAPLSWAPPPPPLGAPPDQRAAFIAARPQAPPGTPRYLAIHTLLI